MKHCLIDGCESPSYKWGMCSLHQQRAKKYGDPMYTKNRTSGSGSLRNDGYIMHETDGKRVLEHVRVAEKALGKPLPKGAVVHHVDENRSNNDPSNLVICPSHSYHALLHKRMRALAACGHADWLKCHICKKYDSPDNVKIYMAYGRANRIVHAECSARYGREKYRVSI